jgi:hypothetical protein
MYILYLSAVSKISWVYITRLQSCATESDVLNHVSSLPISKGALLKCEKLKTRHNSYSSFKIGVPSYLFNDFLVGDIWPEGVLVGKYIPPRSTMKKDMLHVSNNSGNLVAEDGHENTTSNVKNNSNMINHVESGNEPFLSVPQTQPNVS